MADTADVSETRYLPSICSSGLKPNFDSKFLEIKNAEDKLRKLYSLPKGDDSRPDHDNLVYGLIELTDELVEKLQKKMDASWKRNSESRNLQLRVRNSKPPKFGQKERVRLSLS